MDLFSVVGLGVGATLLAITLRQERPDFALVLSLSCGVFLAVWGVSYALPAISEISRLMLGVNLPQTYIEVMLKSVGIALITQFGIDICKDAGESAIAGRLEMCGRIALLVLSLPLVLELLRITGILLN